MQRGCINCLAVVDSLPWQELSDTYLGGPSPASCAVHSPVLTATFHPCCCGISLSVPHTPSPPQLRSDRVRSTVLASRQQTCLHPQVSKMSGGQANNACKALVSHKKCSWCVF